VTGRSGSLSLAPAPAASGDVARDVARLILLLLAFLVLLGGAVGGGVAAFLAALVALALGSVAALGSRLLDWRVLTLLVLATIFVFPVRRVTLEIQVPIDPDPYRIVVFAVMLVWLVALLVDPDVRLRATRFDWPLGLFSAAVVLSVALNPGLVNGHGQDVLKALLLVGIYLLFYYFVASVFTRRVDVELLVRAIVIGASGIAVLATIERLATYNTFDQLARLPGLEYIPPPEGLDERGGRIRVLGSAEHPLALGALLAFVTPFAIYLVRSSRAWLVALALLFGGIGATVSRTPVIMLAVILGVYLWFLPKQTVRVLPIFPIVAVVGLLLFPGLVRPSFEAFFPSQGLLDEQNTQLFEGGSTTINRLGDFQFALRDVERSPIVGHGLGTRVTDPLQTARFLPDGRYGGILDNQWLGTLLELGLLGIAGLVWLVARAVRSLRRESRLRSDADALLATSFAASILAFAIGMLFYDAFAFAQITFVFFFTLALVAVFLRTLVPLATTDEERRRRLLGAARGLHRRRVATQLERVQQYEGGPPPWRTDQD
jgi:MFS family permease